MTIGLNSPIKRAAFIAFLAGILMTVVGYLLIDPTNTWWNLTHLDFRNVARHRGSQESELARAMVWVGLPLSIGGAVLAFTRLEEWILRGSGSR